MSNIEFLEFGLPPAGENAELCASGTVPPEVLKVVAARYEAHYPDVFILAALVDDFFCLYHRTKCAAWPKQKIKRVLLEPAGPAKGPGYILMCIETSDEKHAIPIVSSGFNDRIGAWIEERAERISGILDIPYERLAVGADA
jgi:hypothetical protein